MSNYITIQDINKAIEQLNGEYYSCEMTNDCRECGYAKYCNILRIRKLYEVKNE